MLVNCYRDSAGFARDGDLVCYCFPERFGVLNEATEAIS